MTADLHEKFSAIEKKLESLEDTVASLVAQVEKGFSLTNTKIDTLREDSNLGFQKVDNTMEDVLEVLRKLRQVTRFEEEYDNLPNRGGQA